eukprot:TRINITY_DN5789_c0_g1_i2.p1 TRINITY_DN5789_c0_g1~~TRINITY_DN5789_c0_g1_i2.p1  ORF type:complete len:198 (-),score=10.88 TRINITY_DN5789_c0_g1_i2:147-740(-)
MLILPLAVAVAVSGACVPLAIMQWHCHTTRTQQVDVILPTCGLNGTATLSFSPSATFIRLLAGTNRTSVVSLAVDAGHGLDPALLGPCLAPLVLVANTSCILSCLYVAGNSVASGCEWDVLPLGTLFQIHRSAQIPGCPGATHLLVPKKASACARVVILLICAAIAWLVFCGIRAWLRGWRRFFFPTRFSESMQQAC